MPNLIAAFRMNFNFFVIVAAVEHVGTNCIWTPITATPQSPLPTTRSWSKEGLFLSSASTRADLLRPRNDNADLTSPPKDPGDCSGEKPNFFAGDVGTTLAMLTEWIHRLVLSNWVNCTLSPGMVSLIAEFMTSRYVLCNLLRCLLRKS